MSKEFQYSHDPIDNRFEGTLGGLPIYWSWNPLTDSFEGVLGGSGDDVLALIPEFGVIHRSTYSPNNAVAFYSDGDLGGASGHSYFNGISASATLQTSAIVKRLRLGTAWDSWNTTQAIVLWNKVDTTPGTTGLTLKVYGTDGALVHTSAKQQNTSWTQLTITASDLSSGTFTASGYITLVFEFASQNSKNAYLGEVELRTADAS